MRSYSRLSRLLGICLLQWMPLVLQAQVLPNTPEKPAILPAENKTPVSDNLPLSPLPTLPVEKDRMAEILNFWFGVNPLPGPQFFPEDKMATWFASTPDIDRQIYTLFSQDVLQAERGNYNHWRETPRGRLALILLLDQFPRHIYRNTPQAFALDRMARALVLEGIQKGDDQHLYPIERAFFYLPLEHAEDLHLQNLSVASYRKLVAESPESLRPQMEDFLQSAVMHQQQIARFGRFPARNAILGRASTPEETVFMMQWKNR